ncbi:unnamed protein product [Blepharisma stoltei]|uniref:Countin-like protein n=1 Tax=Blepharisma stoltei TaxID=1481888 RepID=A0AAU9JVU3_9CILI|nr:unnamed protein product [Blepharisma stoltei]
MVGAKVLFLFSILSLCFAEIKLVSIEAVDMCSPCVIFADSSLQQLYNYVMDNTIPGSCSQLCGIFGQNLTAQVCNYLCNAVGIASFVKIVKDCQLDPIYFCELLDVCPVVAGGSANITNTYVVPSSATQYSTFNVQVLFQILKETGTGQVSLILTAPNKSVSKQSYLNEGFKPGTYSAKFQVVTDGMYPAGVYNGVLEVCTGICGATLPNSAILSTGNIKFTVTPKP